MVAGSGTSLLWPRDVDQVMGGLPYRSVIPSEVLHLFLPIVMNVVRAC